jgi:hypothetical protein
MPAQSSQSGSVSKRCIPHASRSERTLTASGHPAPARDVGNGAPVPDEVARCRLAELGVHDTVQAAGLVLVSVDAVLDLFRRVSWLVLATGREPPSFVPHHMTYWQSDLLA